MPIFLVHGFKWSRATIRIHVIINNIEEAAPDYLMSQTTPDAFRASFTKTYPEIMKNIPNLEFVEQYDPEDQRPTAPPYAFVADKVVKSNLSINVREAQEQEPTISPAAWDAFLDLKEKLGAQDEEVGWFAVYNGDVERCAEVVTALPDRIRNSLLKLPRYETKRSQVY